MSQFVPVTHDANTQQPIPSEWRGTLCSIVEAYNEHDYRLAKAVVGVREISENTARRIASNIEAYGAHLVSLPEDSWTFSSCQWMESYWQVLVDLYTAEEGLSDLALHLRVYEEEQKKYSFEVESVHVP